MVTDYVHEASAAINNQKPDFELVGYETQDEQIQALKDGKIDMIFHFTQNSYIAEQNDFILSNTVMPLNMVAVIDQNSFDEKKLYCCDRKNDELLKWYVPYNYANWKFYECDSSEECEKAVLQGKADCFVSEIGNASGYQDNKKFHVISLSNHGNISFATNRNSTALMAVLNKTLKAVSSSVLAGALPIYESTTRQVTVMDFITDADQ